MARVYLESFVISYRTARQSRDPIVFGHQQSTKEWWNNELPKHDVVVSRLVIAEVSRGDPTEAAKRLELLRDIAKLEITDAAGELAQQLVESGALPPKAADDALHLSIAVVHRIDFLLTWNCKHLANAFIRRKMDEVCVGAGYRPTIICTPDEMKEFQS